MNAVEIEEAISLLAEQPFNRDTFAFDFLEAFGNKATTLKRLKSDKKGATNASDLKAEGAVLQRNNIHILPCAKGDTATALTQMRESLSTAKAKAKFILATDGQYFEAENLATGEPIACDYDDFPNHFGFFLPLANISTTKEISDSSFDIRATSRLNRLYVELLKTNPDWDTEEYRQDLNHFMARLIFCFFAEDTDIFSGQDLFTDTVSQMSESNASNTHEVIGEMFRAMNTKLELRKQENIRSWADKFPYVNGGLFSGSTETPVFSKIARSYLIHVGNLDWTQINPDIFGSMIQAVADDEERGSLGMHYTSVPNILKVLNPLFLDELREQLEVAGNNARKLLNLRKRIANIRVFDPACGSGNFLVIAYKQMRKIEAEINRRRDEVERTTEIPLTNYRGIELNDFPAEIARLALIIAEYQCDLQYRGKRLALAEFLPLDAENWITCGNALRLDWLSICPSTGTTVKVVGDDLFEVPLDQAEIDFENEGGETFICGNPPYAGLSSQNTAQKEDMKYVFEQHTKYWKSFDYVAGWVFKASEYYKHTKSSAAFVMTNSICQGQQVSMFWPLILTGGFLIEFAWTSFKWKNLAANNAGVTVVIVGLGEIKKAHLFSTDENNDETKKIVSNINAYLVPGENVYVNSESKPLDNRALMFWGNKPTDGGGLILTSDEARTIISNDPASQKFIRPYFGSNEYIRGNKRFCIWVEDGDIKQANEIKALKKRFHDVKEFRASSKAKETRPSAKYPYRFRQIQGEPGGEAIIIPIHTSENRQFLPVGLLPTGSIISNAAYGLYKAPSWSISIIASRLHLVWIATVAGKIKNDFRYSNTLGWNTFPLPKLTEKNKADLTRCAEDILLAREAHFPATIADLYNPETMPENLRLAHERNDEVLERIYIGRCFKNDTERLEKLFDLYTKMTAAASTTAKKVN